MINIRRYRSSDFDAVWALHEKVLKEAGAWLEDESLNEDLKDIESNYLKDGEFLVVEIDDEIIGMGALRKVDPKTAEIKRMRIRQDHQREGLGQKVYDLLEKKANDLGYKKLILDTAHNLDAAVNFYRKNGFKEVGQKKIEQFDIIYFEKEI